MACPAVIPPSCGSTLIREAQWHCGCGWTGHQRLGCDEDVSLEPRSRRSTLPVLICPFGIGMPRRVATRSRAFLHGLVPAGFPSRLLLLPQ